MLGGPLDQMRKNHHLSTKGKRKYFLVNEGCKRTTRTRVVYQYNPFERKKVQPFGSVAIEGQTRGTLLGGYNSVIEERTLSER